MSSLRLAGIKAGDISETSPRSGAEEDEDEKGYNAKNIINRNNYSPDNDIISDRASSSDVPDTDRPLSGARLAALVSSPASSPMAPTTTTDTNRNSPKSSGNNKTTQNNGESPAPTDRSNTNQSSTPVAEGNSVDALLARAARASLRRSMSGAMAPISPAAANASQNAFSSQNMSTPSPMASGNGEQNRPSAMLHSTSINRDSTDAGDRPPIRKRLSLDPEALEQQEQKEREGRPYEAFRSPGPMLAGTPVVNHLRKHVSIEEPIPPPPESFGDSDDDEDVRRRSQSRDAAHRLATRSMSLSSVGSAGELSPPPPMAPTPMNKHRHFDSTDHYDPEGINSGQSKGKKR